MSILSRHLNCNKELNKLKSKTFTIGKYQAVVSIRDDGNNQPYYPLTCLITHTPTNTEKYVIEHKTVNGLCYQLHKYILLECEEVDAGILFFGVESIRDWLDYCLSVKESCKELDSLANDFATDDWLLK